MRMESGSQFRGSARRSVLVDLGDARTDWATATDASGIRVSARGHAWIDEAYKEEESLAEAVRDRLSGCEPDETADRIQDLVPRLNGGWGLVVERPDGWVAAATDRMRTIPLFWHLSGDQLVIAHDARVCARKAGGRPADVKSTVEFVLAGFITGRETLFEGVQQVQPGEVCIFGPDPPRTMERGVTPDALHHQLREGIRVPRPGVENAVGQPDHGLLSAGSA